MLHNAFALFFMLVLLGSSFGLVSLIAANWRLIRWIACGEPAAERDRVFRTAIDGWREAASAPAPEPSRWTLDDFLSRQRSFDFAH